MPDIRCRLHYSAKLDRLIGGDFIRNLEGRRVKSFLMPLERAKLLAAYTKELKQRYEQAFPGEETPFAQVLAVLTAPGFPAEVDGQEQMVSMDDLFRLDQLAAAPEAFRTLAQVIMMPTDVMTVFDKMPTSAQECIPFATQLFRIVRCGHQSSFTFSRNAGCNLRPDSITPRGELNDLYFLTQLQHDAASTEFKNYLHSDLSNALATLITVASLSGTQLERVLANASETYAQKVPSPLSAVVSKTAQMLDGCIVSSRDTAVAAASLADALLATLFGG